MGTTVQDDVGANPKGVSPSPKRQYRKAALSEGPPSAGTLAKDAAAKLKLAQSVDVDVAADEAFRPLTGMDVEAFRARHGLPIADMVNMLALPSNSHYNKVARKTTALSFSQEFLLRICDAYPTPPPWKRITMSELFDMLYGPLLSRYAPHEDLARVAFYYRFTALFGRSSFTGYRWIEKSGSAKPELVKVAAKIVERQDPRRTAEQFASKIWEVRGVHFDEAFPLPDILTLGTGKRKGRVPGGALRRAKQALTQVESFS